MGISLAELEAERLKVEGLLSRAQRLFARGEESKFEKLREVLRDSEYSDEKFIIFTEHRDTAHFLVRRLEGPGIHRSGSFDTWRNAVSGTRAAGRVLPEAGL